MEFLGVTEKNHRNASQDNHFLRQDLNTEPPKYEEGTLLIWP
jgi:hypothetical protein